MYELTYKCETFSAGFAATDTAIESLEIMLANLKKGIGQPLKEIMIKQVEKPTPLQDGWGRTISDG